MAQTFFFYDLETSGLRAQSDRIMQFAGQRTDLDLTPIGEPINELIRLNDDTLPSPEATLVTGITPQSTVADGYSEAEFARILMRDVFTPETIVVGFNSIRFDDEFIRHLFWRTFHDPYEWHWRDGRSRWDLLDVVRMTRALRPDGIVWPVDTEGRATNRLELLAEANGVTHTRAHDALSDVEALIDVTRLIKQRQPQLFNYLLTLRDKQALKQLVNLDSKRPFVYTSGRYDAEFEKTTVAFPLTAGKNGNVVVYDLRHDPTQFVDLSSEALAAKLFASYDERKQDGFVPLPVKELQYNRAPAVAPLGVLEEGDSWHRIGLDAATVQRNLQTLLATPGFAETIRELFERKKDYPAVPHPEAQLYDGFVGEKDTLRIEAVRNADERTLADFSPEFSDERLAPLLLHYKARNYPRSLSESESQAWEAWRQGRIQEQLPGFMLSLERALSSEAGESQRFVLEELRLWVESCLPAED